MKCKDCGKEVSGKLPYCKECLDAFFKNPYAKKPEADGLLTIASFLFPVIGLLMYLIEEKKSAEVAETYKKWAIIGVKFELICAFVVPFLLLLL